MVRLGLYMGRFEVVLSKSIFKLHEDPNLGIKNKSTFIALDRFESNHLFSVSVGFDSNLPIFFLFFKYFLKSYS